MPKNPFSKVAPVEKPAPAPEAKAPAAPKGPLDCPECCLSINHAGPHV